MTSLLTVFSTACIEKCAPALVGNGVARLTVRNVGAVVQLINDDDVCGFEAEGVKQQFALDGQPGQQGCATWNITACDIDLGAAGDVGYDCNQTATVMTGRVVIDATRTICGTVTGDPNQPVVPVGPDAVTIKLDRVQFDSFKVEDSSADNAMTWKLGEISAVAKPRLAASAAEGICMVPTPHIEVSEIKYKNALVHVVAEGRAFDVPVASSNFLAVNGVHGDRENHLEGEITVWGSTKKVGDDGDGLNPDYNPSKFVEGFACEEDLATPISFECTNVGPVLAQGAARLTIRNLGAVNFITEKDTGCGFTSTPVLENIEIIEGSVGEVGAARFRVENCTIDTPPNTVIKTSCTGSETVVSGKFTVTAEKIMRGRITGDLEQPVVPMNDHPVEFTFERIQFEGFRVDEAGTSMTQNSGALSAKVQPRTAMDLDLTACGAQTPIARMTDVQYIEPASVIVRSEQGRFDTTIEAGNLMAVNGTWQGEENILDGTISVYGETYSLPTNPADDGLDPEYDAATFDEQWMCGAVDKQHPFECVFVRPLAQGASQLSVMTLGRVANLIESDTTCGFAADAILDSVQTSGTLGDPGGVVQFDITQPCRLEFSEPTVIDEDCNGKQTIVQGAVEVTGTKILRGYVSGDRLQPIVPTSRDAAEITLSIDFDNFKILTNPGANELDVFSGNLTGTVRPRLAIDETNGACSLPTPVAMMEKLIWSNGDMQITSEGRAFTVDVATSNIGAVNGNRDGVENMIEGTIVVDGESITIPINPGEGLDPEYDPATFMQSFTCTENLVLPDKEEDCNMIKPIGEGTARLLIAALGATTSIVNSDTDCGYSKLGTLTSPDTVVGDPGEMGMMEWQLNECSPGFDTPYAEDCLGRESFASGNFSHTGRRTVNGIREEIGILFIQFDSIVPNSHNSVTVVHDSLVFDEFNTYDIDPGAESPARGITIHSGTMSATVEPITGRNPDGGYDVPTKVARMSNVVMGPAPVTIVYQGKTFNAQVDSAELYAFNGSYVGMGETNVIEGRISINGHVLEMERQGLDPEFDQADFDARYECTSGLQETIPPASP